MKNLMNIVQSTTKNLATAQKKSFNTNDWLLENLLNKSVNRHEVINMIIVARIKHEGIDTDKLQAAELEKLIKRLYKTSKNGLDTSVSDSNNNSAFSYNERYRDYKLIKSAGNISVVKK